MASLPLTEHIRDRTPPIHIAERPDPISSPAQALHPFLRWAGGKRQIVADLLRLLPHDIGNRLYREPFLGGGALFFALRPNRAVLSDANEHLIKCYEFVRKDWKHVAAYLQQHAGRTSEAYYYKAREQYNKSKYSAAQAARLIYLNKTCFNGIFRVNRKGQFNVPYGWKEPPAIPMATDLRKIADALQGATLRAASFERVLAGASSGDFLFLDPPYPPLNETAYFTHYTTGRFNRIDQEWLAECVRKADRKGCPFMMTNADTDKIRRLYRGFHFVRIPVTRFVTCEAKRYQVRELVVTNY